MRQFPNHAGRFVRALPGLFMISLSMCPALRAQQLVSIPAPDGGTIQADLYGAGDRGVVLAHGGRFDKSSWEKQGRTLAASGFRVLAIDFRAAVQARAGHESKCLYDEVCLALDVLAAVRWLRQHGAKTISVVGASLGGGAAAQAAVEAREGEIDRVVLLAHMPIATPERIKGRKLFIVARGDIGSGDVPRLPGIRDQYEKARDPKALVILDGSAHAQFVFETSEGERLMGEILKFLSLP
jgi:dienelactone hydrolase